jgi:putative ABC transport system permease protein
MEEMGEEMRAHLEMRVDELRALGMSAAQAEAEALHRFGDAAAFRAYAERRAERRAHIELAADWFAEWAQDMRFAARQFRKAPAFSAIATLTLALGIGANTAIFSVVHRLFVSPLPYPNGDRIIALRVAAGGPGTFTAGLASFSTFSTLPPAPVVRAWAARAHSLDMIAGVEVEYLSTFPDGGQDTVTHAFATPSLLPMLGLRPAFGRGFAPSDSLPGAPRVAMISYEWWQRAYAGSSTALNAVVDFNGDSYRVVGVMPLGFTIPFETRAVDAISEPSPNVWMAGRLNQARDVLGRLRPGIGVDDARRELQSIANDVRVGRRTDTLRARPMRAQDFMAPREVRTIEVLFAAVGALLLIACANVANLLLARAWGRRREFAIRMGLGAGRHRLVRLALTESVMLALVGGLLGIAIAWAGLRAIVALRPLSLDNLSDVSLDIPVLVWTAAVSVAGGILFGAATALFSRSQSVGDLLRNETRAGIGTALSRRVRSGLIVAEIALSLVLLVGTGLLVRSFVALQRTPLGFDPHALASVDILTPPPLKREDKPAIRRAVADYLRTMPGARDAAVGTLPTAGWSGQSSLEAEVDGEPRPVPISRFMFQWASPDYFRVARIGLLEGRLPNPMPSDEERKPGFDGWSSEVVVNRSLARRLVSDGHAVGARLRSHETDSPLPQSDEWSTVVGVVDDVKLPGARGDLQEFQVYLLPVARMPDPTFLIRLATIPPDIESYLRNAIHKVSPFIVARRARVGDDYLREALAPTRFALALLGTFAGVALLLSAVGLYGVIAYSVSQRTREIGIRVALGAAPSTITALVVSDGARLAIIGLVVGVAGALAATRAVASLLYDVGPTDPLTFAAIAAVVAAIALVASYLPARRAQRIDPVEALRAD